MDTINLRDTPILRELLQLGQQDELSAVTAAEAYARHDCKAGNYVERLQADERKIIVQLHHQFPHFTIRDWIRLG